VTKRRLVRVHADIAGVHVHPPAVRQYAINKTQGIAVGAVGVHVSHRLIELWPDACDVS
jgi:hypothetical protein